MHKVLVVGGAGYIGSHMFKRLGQLGCAVTTLDNLSSGHRDAVVCCDFIHGDLADTALLSQLLQLGRFDAVMYFASSIQVGESVQQPAKYYENKVTNTLHLLDAMRAVGRAARTRNQPDSLDAASRVGPTFARFGVWARLRHARWNLNSRLHPHQQPV